VSRSRPANCAITRELCRRSFDDFVLRYWPVVTGAPLRPNRATRAVVDVLQRVADGELIRVAIAMPPGCGKSTLLALYAAWRLARDPGHRSIHGAHAFDLAATESRRVRRLVEGEAYRGMFPAVKLRDDESTVAHWATTEDGRFIAVGADGALTGRRAHEAILDDPLNAVDRHSRAARDALWTWLNEALLTRLDGDRAPVIVVHQRLDTDDVIGRLIAADRAAGRATWHVLELPAEDDDGELLAPEVLSRAKLDGIKAQIGSAAYSCQYLQRPASDDEAIIRRTWWRTYTPSELPPKMDRVVVACDLTFGSQRGDFCAIQAWGAKGGARYLLRRFRERCGFERQVATIKSFADEFRHAKIVIEKAANGAAVIESLQRQITGVVPEVPTGSKSQRLAAVAPIVESGACHLPSGAAWVADYIEELAGASRHDDEADAAAYALIALADRERPDWSKVADVLAHMEYAAGRGPWRGPGSW
jgi:predicted phage terminase large subunit-like protein